MYDHFHEIFVVFCLVNFGTPQLGARYVTTTSIHPNNIKNIVSYIEIELDYFFFYCSLQVMFIVRPAIIAYMHFAGRAALPCPCHRDVLISQQPTGLFRWLKAWKVENYINSKDVLLGRV